jgi:hypothetical protein
MREEKWNDLKMGYKHSVTGSQRGMGDACKSSGLT